MPPILFARGTLADAPAKTPRGGTRSLSVRLSPTLSPQGPLRFTDPKLVEMEIQPSLVNDFQQYQGRLSVKTTNVSPSFDSFRIRRALMQAITATVHVGGVPDGQDLLHTRRKHRARPGVPEGVLERAGMSRSEVRITVYKPSGVC